LTITRVISEAADLDAALTVALRRICEATGWKLGQVWIPRADGLLLECSGAWYAATERFGPFHAASQGLTIAPKQSLVGRVWATGQSDWEPNLADAKRFLRSSAALKVGLKTGVAIPVLAEHRTVAVMEFFDTEAQRDDQGLVSVISLISGVAAQLGAAILRKRAEEDIKASLRVKEDLLREVHHRVKNNMQVISSLLNLQAGSIENPIVRVLFRESQARIQAMSFVHEKLYGSRDLAKVDFVEYLQSLAAHLFRLYGVDRTKVRLEINADTVFLSLDTAMPCGLIVNELVSNALKHGFPGKRRGSVAISVTAGKAPGEFILAVSDTGVGFPKEVDFRETSGSLGIRLVLTLVNQLGGRIDLDRSSGTTVTIQFREQILPEAAVGPPQSQAA
jgi:two-component sensor histidine kinase